MQIAQRGNRELGTGNCKPSEPPGQRKRSPTHRGSANLLLRGCVSCARPGPGGIQDFKFQMMKNKVLSNEQ